MSIDECGPLDEQTFRYLVRRQRANVERLTPLQARELSRRAITVCCVCCRPIEPRTEREQQVMDEVCAHDGECWRALRRDPV